MTYDLNELRELLARAKAAGKYTAAARITWAIDKLEEGDDERIRPPECPPSCTGDPWPWCCGGVPT